LWRADRDVCVVDHGWRHNVILDADEGIRSAGYLPMITELLNDLLAIPQVCECGDNKAIVVVGVGARNVAGLAVGLRGADYMMARQQVIS
jgi:hypothetical protein